MRNWPEASDFGEHWYTEQKKLVKIGCPTDFLQILRELWERKAMYFYPGKDFATNHIRAVQN